MCWLASPSIPSKNWTSSCPGIGASSTSKIVRRLDRYILRAIPPRSSPDANVVVASAILQQQWRRPDLAGGMAARQERFVAGGIIDLDPHGLVPAIGHAVQPGIERRPQFRDQIRQRIGKILVFAAPKAVASHHHAAAEPAVVGIGCRERAAFIG